MSHPPPRPVLVQKGTSPQGQQGDDPGLPHEHGLKKGWAQSTCKAMASTWDPTFGPKRLPTPPCPAPQHKAIRVKWAS